MIRSVEQILLKKDNSDFYKSKTSNEILLNNEPLSGFNTFYYRIDPYFDLETDLKLGSKSLLLRYLQVKMEDIEYNPSFESANSELQSLNDTYLKDNNINYELMKINFKIENINLKTILKLIDAELTYDGINANMYDLDYNDLIILQLIIIKEIANRVNKEIILIYDGSIDDELLYWLENNIKDSRIKLLIFTNCNHGMLKKTNYLLMNKQNIDLNSELDVKNSIIMDLPFHIEIGEKPELFKEYIGGKYTSKVIELMKIL